jgi:hypothetical protein
MHIAHSKTAEFLSVEQLAKLAGLQRRQIANLARAGEIPGARRSADGYHFEYPDAADLRLWIDNKRRQTEQRLQFLPPRRHYHRSKVTNALRKAGGGRARGLQKAAMLACLAEVREKATAKHYPGLIRLIILREIEISGAHPDLLKRYRLPIGEGLKKSIAKWKLALLVAFLAEFICTEGGNFYELSNDGEHYLKKLGVDVRSIQKRIENKRKHKLLQERLRKPRELTSRQ